MTRAWVVAMTVLATSSLAQGRFVASGPLSVARVSHTATLLADGRVLVTGGRTTDGLTTLASAEVFDVKAKAWKVVAPMSTGRSHHTATLLADGRVLVTGGTSADPDPTQSRFVALDTAEVFDPVKNTWTRVAPLHDARNGHTATLLDDGSVLVVGGAREQRVHLASVERYEVKTNTWTVLAPLHVARWMHAAVKLKGGEVLVMGGRGAGKVGSLDSVERFDLDAGAWSTVPAMTEPRQRTGAVLLDDGVVVLGGQTATSSTNLAETWAPGAEAWKPLENHLSMALASHSATLLGKSDLLVIGGEPPNAVDTTRAQRWSHATKQWCLAGELRLPRKSHTATALKDGRVLVVGGTSSGVPEVSTELWEDAKGKCEEPPGVNLGW
jgi:hypothetical protein